jgi:hypothetical protein
MLYCSVNTVPPANASGFFVCQKHNR